MRIRNDLLKYRAELFKYSPLIAAAKKRDQDFLVTSRWSFFVIGAEDRIIADVHFGWAGILAEKPCPQIVEFIICLEDPGIQEIVQEKIDLLYDQLFWIPFLPIRYLSPEDFYQERSLPMLEGWYDPDTGKIHYCNAYQIATRIPMLESICGKMSGSYYSFGDPLPFIEPEFIGDVCKHCRRAGKKLDIIKPERYSRTIEIHARLADNESYEDICRVIKQQAAKLEQQQIELEYIHVEIIGASWSLLLANECMEQVRNYCRKNHSDIESYITFV